MEGTSDLFTAWQVLRLCVICVVATLGMAVPATWYVARTRIEDELRQYERSKDWKLPENLEALGKLSQSLGLQIKEREEFESLKREERELKIKVEDLTRHLAAADSAVQELRQMVAVIEHESFEVPLGEARFIVPGILSLGLRDTSTALNTASVDFAGQSSKLTPGGQIVKSIGGRRYVITLIKVQSKNAFFAVAVQDEKAEVVAKA